MSFQKDESNHQIPSEKLFRIDIRFCLLRLLQGYVACFISSIIAMCLAALLLTVFAKSSILSDGNSDLLLGGLLFAAFGSVFTMWIPAGLYWATRSYRAAIVTACFVGAFIAAVFFPLMHEMIQSAG
ncbi:MAG TPA: hypothetical protein PLN21_20665 [Gemmatales bacterium]|nr:hypothetical protein [Gemmatales bacterium]